MKSVRIDLPKTVGCVEIHTLADWHIGDKHCNIESIRAIIDYIKDTPNAYIILNGDLMNNATKTSVSDSYAEEIPPMQAMQRLVDLLEPIKDRILMITQGNHEARTYRNDGVDLTYLVTKQLGIADKYVGEGGVLFLRFGEQTGRCHFRPQIYTIYATHGCGGGRKEGGKAIRLADLASIVDCDIYIHSHTHLPMIMKQAFYRVSGSNSSVAKVDKLFVNTSAQLEYGGYGQTFEFKPSSIESPVIYLDGHKHHMSAKL